ncbi:MAG: class I SAM-dependent methyltransferase [Candidatus Lindowbacteria bacterium]|nr:class I SAM-dependent methyltransferase [Candidatus Lindowbacteria bacterium]
MGRLFHKRKYDPNIRIVPDSELRKAVRPPYNKLCDISDWREGPFTEYLRKLNESPMIHRKAWEYANCVWGLEELGVVCEESVALSVAAGHERPLFYFANKISRVVATDMYGGGPDGDPEMLTNPWKFAPFPYRKDHLEVFLMDGAELSFAPESFDFIFSLCSIEHFGGHERAAKAMGEMYRVLKAGGVCCVSTEIILNNRPHNEYFTHSELEQYVLKAAPFSLAGTDTIDLRISESLLRHPIKLGEEEDLRVSPHIVLEGGRRVFTSIILFLRK